MYYILDDEKNPVKTDVDTWAKWYETKRTIGRVVRQDHINGYFVSTVFLGLDHSFGKGEIPVLWETMIFEEGDWTDLYAKRYTSNYDALCGHLVALQVAEKGGLE